MFDSPLKIEHDAGHNGEGFRQGCSYCIFESKNNLIPENIEAPVRKTEKEYLEATKP